MNSDVTLVVAIFAIVIALIVVLSIVGRRRQLAIEAELKKEATTRGWTFTKVHERGHRIYRYTGTTDGISWVAESARFTTGGGGNNRRQVHHVARWHGRWSPGVSGPIVGMGVPKGKEDTGVTVAEGDGFFARMAQKAAGYAFDKVLDVYFGKPIGDEIDARDLRRVNVRIPGFIVMALRVDEAERVMADGLERVLESATNDEQSALSGTDRPWVLARPEGISLARMTQFRDVRDVERFIHTGIGLTRAFKFGRRV